MSAVNFHDYFASWRIYFESNPLVILYLVLGLWAFGLWNRRTSTSSSKDEKTTTGSGYPPIEPLPGFDWETTEPLAFRPFKPKYHLTMALSNLDVSNLIPMDKTYKERIALRRSLFEQYPDVVVRVNNDSDPRVRAAIKELYAFVMAEYLPTRYPRMFRLISPNQKTTLVENRVTGETFPAELDDTQPIIKGMEILGQNVDEDFLILLPETSRTTQTNNPNPDEDQKYILEAYATFFPSGFDSRKKLGLQLASIHEPVPGYKDKLERSMDRFFAKLEVGKFVQRVNWTVTTDSELFAAFGGVHSGDGGGEERPIVPGELDVESTLLRCERQTLHRLPKSKALVFAFHTYRYPIQMIKDEGLSEDLANAIDGLKDGSVPMMHWYKRGSVWGEAVKAFLRS